MDVQESPQDFVGRMVDILIKRYIKKINEVTPQLSEREILDRTDDVAMKNLMLKLDASEKALKKADAAHEDNLRAFTNLFGDQAEELLAQAKKERVSDIDKRIKDFEFDIRTAIGQVYLMGTVEAYCTLEKARRTIRNLGQETEPKK